jgi:O-acetyl-ADP-ribose deacetylase (regulator of RNase III)
MRIRVEEGDIAAAEVDAIVCLCNTRLEPASGSASLLEAAGAEVREACAGIVGLPLGDAVVTGGGALRCAHLIHAAIQAGDEGTSEEPLRAAVRRSLERACERGARTLALPAPDGGGIALQRCAEIMFEEARSHGETATSLEEVRFVLRGEPRYRIFEQVGDADRIRASLARLAR